MKPIKKLTNFLTMIIAGVTPIAASSGLILTHDNKIDGWTMSSTFQLIHGDQSHDVVLDGNRARVSGATLDTFSGPVQVRLASFKATAPRGAEFKFRFGRDVKEGDLPESLQHMAQQGFAIINLPLALVQKLNIKLILIQCRGDGDLIIEVSRRLPHSGLGRLLHRQKAVKLASLSLDFRFRGFTEDCSAFLPTLCSDGTDPDACMLDIMIKLTMDCQADAIRGFKEQYDCGADQLVTFGDDRLAAFSAGFLEGLRLWKTDSCTNETEIRRFNALKLAFSHHATIPTTAAKIF